MTVPLRPFQFKLKSDVHQAWREGAKSVMPVAATGSGKTVVISDIMTEESGASIAIAHRQELVSQIAVALARNGVRHRLLSNNPTLTRVISALQVADIGYTFLDPNARTAVVGVDTMVRMNPNEPIFHQARLGVQDEGHHVLRKNKWGRAWAMLPNARWLLPTATPIRADGHGLGAHADGVVDRMVLAPTMREIIDMGFLTDYRIFAPPSDVDLSRVAVSNTTGDFNPEQLRQAVHASHVVGDIMQTYLARARGKLGVTFAVDVESAKEIAAAFRAAGIPAEVVSAKTPDSLRDRIIRRFKAREILQLVNVDLFGEGFDLPAIECVSFGRPTESFSLYSQQFGRALRLMLSDALLVGYNEAAPAERLRRIAASSKPVALIFDHVGNVLRHCGPPDRKITWSLDRRERRAIGPSDAIPFRVCTSWADETASYLGCLQPFERVHKACPFCGCPVRPPAQRSAPELVDGDLTEFDPALLRALRGEIDRINGDFYPPKGLEGYAAVGARRSHDDRRQAHNDLRNSIAWWAGLQAAQGRPEAESYRRFYFRYGLDVATAQTLPAAEARELSVRICRDLRAAGIDGTVNAVEYLSAQRH